MTSFVEKLNELFASSPREPDHALKRYSINDFKKTWSPQDLRAYRQYWKKFLSSGAELVYPNGWAFSTFSGFAHYENRVVSEPFYKEYYTAMPNEWITVANAIRDACSSGRDLGGAIVYGHGNLIQEGYILSKLMNMGMGRFNWHLLDCSLPYHLMAASPFNALLLNAQSLKKTQIHSYLVDFFKCGVNGNLESADTLRYIRERVGVTKSALHFHIGNTVCNTLDDQFARVLPGSEASSARREGILCDWVASEDIFVIEYLNYSDPTAHSDPIEVMARRAASEIFEVSESKVVTKWTKLNHLGQTPHSVLKIDVDGITFMSMLRRNFDLNSYFRHGFQLIDDVTLKKNEAGALQVAILKKS